MIVCCGSFVINFDENIKSAVECVRMVWGEVKRGIWIFSFISSSANYQKLCGFGNGNYGWPWFFGQSAMRWEIQFFNLLLVHQYRRLCWCESTMLSGSLRLSTKVSRTLEGIRNAGSGVDDFLTSSQNLNLKKMSKLQKKSVSKGVQISLNVM